MFLHFYNLYYFSLELFSPELSIRMCIGDMERDWGLTPGSQTSLANALPMCHNPVPLRLHFGDVCFTLYSVFCTLCFKQVLPLSTFIER